MAYGQGGWRRRNMYRLTGLPGWMRLGYSSGWMGRSPTELPPTAQHLMQTEQVPRPYPAQAQTLAPTHGDCANFKNGFCALYGAVVDPGEPVCQSFMPRNPTVTSQISPMQPTGFPPAHMPQIPKEQEIQMLDDQARMLEQQLQHIKKRIEELGKY
jgi:hypothetical protein